MKTRYYTDLDYGILDVTLFSLVHSEADGSSEILAPICQTMWCHIPDAYNICTTGTGTLLNIVHKVTTDVLSSYLMVIRKCEFVSFLLQI